MCASNLRQIGYAIQFYANEHGGKYPAGFDEMLTQTDLTSDVLICPSGNDVRATGPTTAQVVQDLLNNPGRCSYVYVAAGLTSASVTPSHVLAYEPAKNHAGHPEPPGLNILYGDGTVRWTPQPQADTLLADLAAGHNPPRPATMSAQQP